MQPYMYEPNKDSQEEKEELLVRGHLQVDVSEW